MIDLIIQITAIYNADAWTAAVGSCLLYQPLLQDIMRMHYVFRVGEKTPSIHTSHEVKYFVHKNIQRFSKSFLCHLVVLSPEFGRKSSRVLLSHHWLEGKLRPLLMSLNDQFRGSLVLQRPICNSLHMMLWTDSQLLSLSGLGSFLCRLWKTLSDLEEYSRS